MLQNKNTKHIFMLNKDISMGFLRKTLRDASNAIAMWFLIILMFILLAYISAFSDKQDTKNEASETLVYVEEDVIYIRGKIDELTPKLFLDQMLQVTKKGKIVKTVDIDSPGGVALAGVQIAENVREFGLNTRSSNFCHSSCTLIFVAGKERSISFTTIMGFHSVKWFGDERNVYNKEYIDKLLNIVNHTAGQIMKVYLNGGLSPEFVSRIQSTPSDSLLTVYGADLLKHNIATDFIHFKN